MMTTDATVKKLGLYVHIPFCLKKCAYCDFYSQTDYSLSDDYLSALLREAEIMGERYAERVVDTVYIGGGTPSSLTPDALDRFLKGLRKHFSIEQGVEFTLEANPATLDENKLAVLQKNGVNRLSIGLQSACDSELKTLSRIHSFEEFEATYRLARKWISNISLDLMFGLPEQTALSFQKTLDAAVSLHPDHISLYALKIEEGTPFAQKEETLALPSEDIVSDMYLFACSFLKNAGYHQYEISNFARQGCSSRHNLRYWKREDYVGLGPSAHSFVNGRRYANARDIGGYIRALSSGILPPHSEDYAVTPSEALEEEIMLRLRLSEGLDMAYLEEKTGYAMEKTAARKIQRYLDNGFMKQTNHTIAFTPRGFLVSNTILTDLLPD